MAARGSVLKGEISKKILEVFPNSFLYNDGKEIRINGTEDGVPIQIKVTLTAAKVAVDGGENCIVSGDNNAAAAPISSDVTNEKIPQEPSQEEKERLTALLDKLGL